MSGAETCRALCLSLRGNGSRAVQPVGAGRARQEASHGQGLPGTCTLDPRPWTLDPRPLDP
eukprot:314514-Rhodomonas_salina.2